MSWFDAATAQVPSTPQTSPAPQPGSQNSERGNHSAQSPPVAVTSNTSMSFTPSAAVPWMVVQESSGCTKKPPTRVSWGQ